MMDLYYRLSLKNKIAFVIISMVVVFAVVGFYLDFKHENEFIKTKLLEEKVLTAKIVGSYAASDIAFENKESAIVSLSYLETDESTINVHLFSEKKEHFVSLYPQKDIPNFSIGLESHQQFIDNELLVSEPIYVDEKLFGYILLQASTASFAEDYQRNIRYFILLFIGLVILVVIMAGPMASLITAPISSLVEAAKKVSRDNDYISTITVKSKDEISELVDAFNEMLFQIHLRENERDKASESLKDNEELLKLILNNMVVGVMSIDEEGVVKSFNHAAEKIFKYKESEIIEQSALQLLPKEQRLRLVNEVEFYRNTGSLDILGAGVEIKGLTKDNDIIPLYVSVAEVTNPKSRIKNFIISFEDITNKQIQEEQVRRTQRMDALGNLTGGIAHDYNNMLGVILGYTELLAMNPDVSDKLSSYIKEISYAAEKARKLTSKLLAFTKRSSTESEVVNVNELLKNSENMIRRTLTVKISLAYELQDDLWNVWLDEGDLEDAIINLSINAMHAMENGGELVFNSRNIVLSEIEARPIQLPAGEYVMLRVSDTGSGMDEATRIRIFEPFFSTKDDKGTGLGLSQVYGFVKRANGEVKVYSELGKGTHFDFYFPRYHAERSSKQIESENEELIQYAGTEKILVVDDEPGLRKLADELLMHFGYLVTSAESAEHALELLETEKFDLMFSDVIMTGMDGYQLAEKTRAKYPDMKIQLASGFSDKHTHHESVRDLQQSILQKPYRKAELLKRVRELLDN